MALASSRVYFAIITTAASLFSTIDTMEHYTTVETRAQIPLQNGGNTKALLRHVSAILA
jgi:hypothetical protein